MLLAQGLNTVVNVDYPKVSYPTCQLSESQSSDMSVIQPTAVPKIINYVAVRIETMYIKSY